MFWLTRRETGSIPSSYCCTQGGIGNLQKDEALCRIIGEEEGRSHTYSSLLE